MSPNDTSSLSELVEKYWDSNVANWKIAHDLKVGSKDFFQEVERYRFEKLSYLNDYADYSAYAGKKVLDVGCGLGTDTARLAKAGASVTGIDISSRAIELSETNFEQRSLRGEFKQMNGERMSFEDNSFDFVYCHTVLHFTPSPTELVKEIYRVIKPGGEALMMMINRRSWLFFLHRLAKLKIDYLDSPVFHLYARREFDALCSQFDSYDIKVERFPTRTEVHSGLKALIYNKLFVDLYNSLPNKVIGNTGYHLLARCQKHG